MPSPAHPDAFGYINDLALDVGKPWFADLTKLATVHGHQSLAPTCKARVLELFHTGSTTATAPAAIPAAGVGLATAGNHIEWLGEFENFKRLPGTLKLTTDKRVTIVFGRNGSGKTSISDAIKLLVNLEEPKRPLNNVRSPSASNPSFKVKLRSETNPRSWSKGQPLGILANTVKYFDAEIAGRNVQSAVEPGRIIELTPFKLHAFNTLRAFVSEIRDALGAEHEAVKAEISSVVSTLLTVLGPGGATTFPGGTVSSVQLVEQAIALANTFPGAEAIATLQAAAAEMEKATSELGLKVLANEARDTGRLIEALKKIRTEVDRFWSMKAGTALATLGLRQSEQSALAKALVPSGVQQAAFLGLLKAAHQVHDLATAKSADACSLCLRPIGSEGERLFHEYHKLITNALEQEIVKLKRVGEDAENIIDGLPGLIPQNLDAWTIDVALRTEGANAIRDLLNLVKKDTDESAPGTQAKDALLAATAKLEVSRTQKTEALATASKDLEEPKKKLALMRSEVAKLQDVAKLHAVLPDLNKVLILIKKESHYRASIPTITPVLTKVSNSRRMAHTALVFGTFEQRLNREYVALAEKKMEDFGVALTPKTQRDENAAMVLETLVGPAALRNAKNTKSLDDVLSEGEKRMHALALFFAEAETSGHSVVVFDDPVSSFDYNYTENFCCRLRDFTASHANTQIIVLTHSWEFFVQLQEKFRPIPHVSIQVLESCTTVAEYLEKIPELTRLIEPILQSSSEPTSEQKSNLAMHMRILIEAIVNTHVFKGQRHQYKNKDIQKASNFRNYMNLVPLLPAEAKALSDLYSKLSVTEHDDPRNNIITTDKAAYKTRYNEIVAIETAIKARMPVAHP